MSVEAAKLMRGVKTRDNASTPRADVETIVSFARTIAPVFPCRAADKKPLTAHGFKDATRDSEQIRTWWAEHPDALVGVPTGTASGMVLVDHDSYKPDVTGASSEWIASHAGALCGARVHATRRGGKHYLFSCGVHRLKSQNGAELGRVKRPAIDVKAEGGYLIWWPFHGGTVVQGEGEPTPMLPAGLLDELLETADSTSTRGNAGRDPTPDAELLAIIRGREGRHDAMLKLAARWAARGINADDIAAVFITELPERYNAEGRDLHTVAREMAQSAVAKYGDSREVRVPAPPIDDVPPFDYSGDPEAHGITPNCEPEVPRREAAEPAVRRFDLQAAASQRRPVVQGLFDEGTVAAGCGEPNAGKTAFFVHLGLTVASVHTGSIGKWMGLKFRGGPVAYFAAEAPGSVKLRYRAAAKDLGLQDAGALYLFEQAPGLGGDNHEAAKEWVIAKLNAIASAEGTPTLLAIFDTLAACLDGGDENGEGMLRLVAAAEEIAKRTGVCVIFLHHPSKTDPLGLRGHSSLRAACDSVIRIEADSPAAEAIRTATLSKAREGVSGQSMNFELERVTLPERDYFGDLVQTVVMRTTVKRPERALPSGMRQRALLTELERRHRDGEHSWDESKVAAACKGIGMQRSSAISALSGLVKSGYLTGSKAGYSLRRPPEE